MDAVINQLNQRFKNTVIFYQILKQKPKLVNHDVYEVNEKIQERALEIHSKLDTDDPHAVLIHPINYTSNPVTFHYKKLLYSQLLALRQLDEKPPLITANIVAIDAEKQQIVLHHRSPKSHVYPDKLSLPGGGFWPPETDRATVDSKFDTDITCTATREFFEETLLKARISPETVMILSQEVETGSVQVNFLGATTKIENVHDINWEGDTQLVSFNKLYKTLTSKNWVPLGKSCVLAWLALGSPGAGAKFNNFGNLTAQELYNKYIDENPQEKIS